MASGDQEPSQSLEIVGMLQFESGTLENLLVQYSQILVGLRVSLVMLDRRVDSDRFKRGFFPARDDVPAKSSSGQMVQRAKAFGEEKGRLE
jgi:hypothetical protein